MNLFPPTLDEQIAEVERELEMRRRLYMAFGPPLMVAAAAAGHQEAQQNVFNTCMEAQGWTGTRIR